MMTLMAEVVMGMMVVAFVILMMMMTSMIMHDDDDNDAGMAIEGWCWFWWYLLIIHSNGIYDIGMRAPGMPLTLRVSVGRFPTGHPVVLLKWHKRWCPPISWGKTDPFRAGCVEHTDAVTKWSKLWRPNIKNQFSWMESVLFRFMISRKFVLNDPINNESALFKIMVWRRTVETSFYEPMIT